MNAVPVQRAYSEKLISGARFLLAVTSFAAVRLTEPTELRIAPFDQALAAYLIYSIVSLVYYVRKRNTLLLPPIGAHIIDLAAGAFLNYYIEGTASPFFVFLMFAVLSAALRFSAQGVSVTGVCLLGYYVMLGIRDTITMGDQLETTRFAMRVVYIFVITAMLVFLMRYQEEMQVKLEQLADWPRRLNRQFPVFLEDVLRRANRLMRVEKTVIVWEDGAEPWLYAASLGREGFSLVEQPPDTYLRLVEDWVQHDTFATEDCTAVGDVVVFGEQADRIQSGCPVAPRLVEMYSMKRVLSSPLISDTIGGRAFFLGASQFTEDDATLAQIIAALITSGLEQHFMLQQVQRSAVTEERQHFARDLHDGIVQSLAGANLHLHILERLIEKDPGAARSTLRDIQSALTHEQRELRAYIAQLRPAPGDSDTVTSVRHGLDVLAQRVERQWGVKVSIYFDPTIELASTGMREELQRIIREAVTNAAKHAGASSIQVKVHLRGDRIEATIEDDGHGFAFFGKYDLESLQSMKRGPLTLRERVAAAGGNLVLESKPNGSRIDVSLPPSLIEAHFAQTNSHR